MSRATSKIVFSNFISQIILNNVELDFSKLTTLQNPFQQFYFSNLDLVILSNITLNNFSIERKVPLFYFSNIQQIIFDNITINALNINCTDPTLIYFENISDISIYNLQINKLNINTDTQISSSQLIYVEFVNTFLIKGALLDKLYSSTQQSFLKIQGIKNLTLQNLLFQNSDQFSLLSSFNFYLIEDTKVLVEQNIAFLSNVSVNYINRLNQSLIQFNETDYTNLKNCSFQKINCSQCFGGVLQIFQGNKHKILDSKFQSISAQIGGVLAIIECPNCDIAINNSNFQQNTASVYGGAIYLQNSNVSISQTNIQKNEAMIGGGVKYTQIKPILIENKIFRNLKKDEFYDFFKSDESFKLRYLDQYQNQIINNKAHIYGNNIGSYLRSIRVVEPKLQILDLKIIAKEYDEQEVSDQFVLESYSLNNFRSGGSLDLQIQVLDEEGNPINFIPSYIKEDKYQKLILNELYALNIKIGSLDNNKIKVFGIYTANFEQFNMSTQTFTIQNMQIVQNPSSSNILKVMSDSLIKIDENSRRIDQQNTNKLYSLLQVNTRSCELGEVYDKVDQVYQCYECQQGTYFLQKPTQSDSVCLKCPQNAQQCELNKIQLKQGYWRMNQFSDRIIQCSRNIDNCVPNEAKNYCTKGHSGPLCEQCDIYGVIWEQPYITDGNYNCYPCTELQNRPYYSLLTLNLSLMIMFIIISIFLQLHFSRCIAVSYYLRKIQLISISKSAFWNQSSFGLKTFVSFLQMTGLIFAQLEFTFPFGTRLLSKTVGMPSTNLFYSMDCIFRKFIEMKIVYLRALWSLFIPILYLIVIFIILIFYALLKRRSTKILLINGAAFLFFFTQNSIVYLLLSMMSCRQIDGNFYINSDISYECFTHSHLQFMKYIGIPGLIGWILIIPLYIFYKLYKQKKELDLVSFRSKYGHLYNEYKSKYYYWDFIKSYKKLLITSVLTLYVNPLVKYQQQHKIDNKLIFGFLVQLVYIQLISRIKPYFNSQLNRIELFVEICIAILLFTTILINQSQTPENSYSFYLLISLNSFVECLMILWISKEILKVWSYHSYNKIKKQIISLFIRLKVRTMKFQKISQSVRHLLLWKKLRKQLLGENLFEYLNQVQLKKGDSKIMNSRNDTLFSQNENNSKFNQNQIKSRENIFLQYKQQHFDKQFPRLQSNFKIENGQKSQTNVISGFYESQLNSQNQSVSKQYQPQNFLLFSPVAEQRYLVQQSEKEKFKLHPFKFQNSPYEQESQKTSQKNLFSPRLSFYQNKSKKNISLQLINSEVIMEQSDTITITSSNQEQKCLQTEENKNAIGEKLNNVIYQYEKQNFSELENESNRQEKQLTIRNIFNNNNKQQNLENISSLLTNIQEDKIQTLNSPEQQEGDQKEEIQQKVDINEIKRIFQARVPANMNDDEVDSIHD